MCVQYKNFENAIYIEFVSINFGMPYYNDVLRMFSY